MKQEQMKCIICGKEALPNLVICSDHCDKIMSKMYEISNKYFPTNGCENCWGDLHKKCTEQCLKESKEHFNFLSDLWQLIHFIFNQPLN